MALVPMGGHVFFLSQLQCFGYVIVYYSILYSRVWAGVVPREMLLPGLQAPVCGHRPHRGGHQPPPADDGR
eukprot:CAMPEP_0177583234 /NCGR_PEP_ID=MMETSP0419_2-20121207/3207_1 /TAXON_ID=582737 /ORGANISM="Tetraselmis sp., Strain GSL018" /LENGTH=70 /DNA_ID=CAMNT_0019072599 /DNA_START=459 /DNA_END=668 /DNA_ORIENTATION=-